MKKKLLNLLSILHKVWSGKLWKVMRITMLFMILGLGNIFASVSSQSVKVDLALKDVSVKTAIEAIEQKTDLKFLYRDDLIDINKTTSVDASEIEINDLMACLFDNTRINYNVYNGNLIVISPAQQNTITGTVKDTDGNPLPGVNIQEKGTTNGAITDFDGNYKIITSTEKPVLIFSYIGYKAKEINIEGKTKINVSLEADVTGLDEVVVVGYGVQKKSDVTGAMVSVNSEDLNERPVSNAFEALQGRAAGVDITTEERPGELGDISIRGVRSLSASNDPLYVVDGIPLMSSSTIETLNPRDIKSIDILKDASATAIYGSRGANGVIIVTTKKGEKGKFSLNYTGTVTTEKIVDLAPMMNASDYITWRRWAYYNSDPESYPRGDEPELENDKIIFKETADTYAWANIENGWESGTWDGSKVKSTNWTEYVEQTSVTQEHTISASGGTDKMMAYGSFGYLDNEGTQIGQAYTRYTTNLSIDINPKDWFSMGGSINASWSDQDYGMSTLGNSSSSNPDNIFGAAKKVFCYAVPYDDDGEIITNPGGDENVYTIINEWDKSIHQRQMFRVLGSFYATINFGKIFQPLEGLNYRFNFGPDYRNWREGVYIDAESVNRLGGTSYARLKNQRDFSWTLDNIITYNKSLDKHSFNVTLLQTASSWNIESNSMSGINIPKSSYLWNNFGSLDVTDSDASVSIGSGITEKQLTSYMGRINYAFNERYLLTASARWDGASQLAEEHKWAFFPSVALGWRIEKESFMQSITFINQLKLRAGYGATGNSDIDAYSTLGDIIDFYVPFGGENNEQAYTINELNYNKNSNMLANEELTWEKTTQYNIGIDFSLFSGRIAGTIDIYKSHTNDLIMEMDIPVVTGYNSTYANIGETKNKGIDITLNTLNIDKNGFRWRMQLNGAWQKDEIVSLAYGSEDMVDNEWFIGESLNVIYDIDGDGLWQEEDAEEMEKFNDNGHEFEVGLSKPVDQNSDYTIDDDDRVIIGHDNPNWTVGFNNTFSYKGIELSAIIFGRLGYTVSTDGEIQIGRYNQREIDYWTPDNTDSEYQKPIYNESGGDAYYSVLGYFSGSFLKLRTVSLGYNFPKSLTNKLRIDNLKIYAQGKNLGIIYSDIDFRDQDTGRSNYNRGFVLGVNIGF